MASPLDDLPQHLADLIRRFGDLVDAATERLAELGITFDNVREWQDALEELIMRYHQAAYMVGAGTSVVSEEARDKVLGYVRAQVDFLDNFAIEIQGADEFQAGWNSRAKSYASAIKVPYWTGRTKLLPLPAMPAQGTQCHNNCGCSWSITDLGNNRYSAKWVREKDDSCQTCIQRESEWANLLIEDGVLQL